MALTSADLLQYAYFRCLPEVYRDEDKNLGYPLYRYLQTIILGGYELSVQDIENLLNLVDPENCPEEFFPFLYESFGLEYYPDVDVDYHRKLLMNYGELKRRRGTYSCIKFLVRVLTSLDVKLRYFRGEYQDVYGRYLVVSLQAKTIEEILNLDNDSELIQKFLGLFIPYYITVIVEGQIAVQEVKTNIYRSSAITFYSKYYVGNKS